VLLTAVASVRSIPFVAPAVIRCSASHPLPIYDPKQETSYLREFMILFRPGDIVKWRPIGRQEYDSLIAEVAAGSFFPRETQISFSLEAFDKAPATYNRQILEVLNGR
jgi:urea carboxylase